ncbi:MAG: 16S rRNA (guanine(966)-N(2))-methyltransferase RsmD [Chromatiales bacterium]|jgi:16S rRNA (guanine966-N2)-methyltransferase
MAKRPGSSNRLRIIGGSMRGRILSFPSAKGLRPTADRIRETLFNWLQHDIAGSRCLDLFAGSGALGFEAASRGAGQVVMLDNNPAVIQQLQQNVHLLGLQQQVEVVSAAAMNWLAASQAEPFDVVFLDPPFADAVLQQAVDALHASRLLAPQALLYIERDRNQDLPQLPSGWHILRDKQAGQVSYSLIACGE